jgi:hypothetical protein
MARGIKDMAADYCLKDYLVHVDFDYNQDWDFPGNHRNGFSPEKS